MGRLYDKPAKRKTPDEMLAAVRQMNAALGGKDMTQEASGDG